MHNTLSTVRLYAHTMNPCESMFKIKFCPITARPISAMSAFLWMKHIEHAYSKGCADEREIFAVYLLRHNDCGLLRYNRKALVCLEAITFELSLVDLRTY